MQALSLGVHIPLVCFGIAVPGDRPLHRGPATCAPATPIYQAIAKRWSKVMLILFAVGVVTGTILSFELGLLWPRVHGRASARSSASPSRSRASRSSSRRSSSRSTSTAGIGSRRGRTSAIGIPIVIAGFTGSLFVIAVNGWMNEPTGLRAHAGGEVTDVEPVRGAVQLEPLARADPHVPRRVHRRRLHRRRRLRVRLAARPPRPLPPRRADRPARRSPASRRRCSSSSATGPRARWPRTSRPSWPPSRASSRTTKGADADPRRHLLSTARPTAGSRSPTCSRCSPTTTRTRPCRASTRSRRAIARRSAVVRNAFTAMVAIGTALAALAAVYLFTWLRRGRLPRSKWFYRAVVLAGPARARRPDRRLDRDRGRAPALDRLRGDAHRGGGHRRRGRSRSATRPSPPSTSALGGGGALAAAPAGAPPDRARAARGGGGR